MRSSCEHSIIVILCIFANEFEIDIMFSKCRSKSFFVFAFFNFVFVRVDDTILYAYLELNGFEVTFETNKLHILKKLTQIS
jgi:hypothetical protein